jgi:hypothetical protein
MNYVCELRACVIVTESLQRLIILGNYHSKLGLKQENNTQTTFVGRILYSNTPRSTMVENQDKFMPELIDHVHQNGWRGTYLFPSHYSVIKQFIFVDSTSFLLYLLYHKYKHIKGIDSRYLSFRILCEYR